MGDTDGDYCGNGDVVGDDCRDDDNDEGINNRHGYDAIGILWCLHVAKMMLIADCSQKSVDNLHNCQS